MKKIIAFALLATSFVISQTGFAQQDKSKRPSPPATVSEKIKSGATITITYSQPSVKGRTIGNDLEPMPGKVWRMGANEATVFETDKEVKIDGKELPAGKYSIFGLQDGDHFHIMFNTEWKTWGTNYEKVKEKDVLKITADMATGEKTEEKLIYTIDKDGTVKLLWGEKVISFKVK